MAKYLNGSELAGFIKERQAKAVRGLRQAGHVQPKLAIVQIKDDPVINTYVRLKRSYGDDILVDVDVHRVSQAEAEGLIAMLNDDQSVHGIILQLPIDDPSQTDKLCNLVAPHKDVDALGINATHQPATPMAILWLLAGYNIELAGKNILVVGQGKLVGKPLTAALRQSGLDVVVADSKTQDLKELSINADVVVTATGIPSLIKSDMLKPGAVIVDAGVASESGKIVGDVSSDVYDRDDITITPTKGGVGPLTICALFENVISAAREAVV